MVKLEQTHTRQGSRRIELYVPFVWEGKMVKAIDIGPARLDHLLRWQRGDFATALDLLAEMVGVPVALIHQLRYPDADRVIAAYVDMVPPQIQADIARGAIPALAMPAPAPAHAHEGEPEPEPEPEMVEIDREASTLGLPEDMPEEPEPEVVEEPGWPYQGPPPEGHIDYEPPDLPREPEHVDLDLIGEG